MAHGMPIMFPQRQDPPSPHYRDYEVGNPPGLGGLPVAPRCRYNSRPNTVRQGIIHNLNVLYLVEPLLLK